MTTYVWIDTETGGLRPDDRPWEIAMTLESDDRASDEIVLHVADFRASDADPGALQLGGYYQRHPLVTRVRSTQPSTVVSEEAAATIVERWTRDAIVGGCNFPGYDQPRLVAMLARHGLAWSAHYQPIDVTAFAAGRAGVAPPWGSKTIGALYGVEHGDGGQHSAIVDARFARDLYRAALAGPPTGSRS